MFIDFVCDNNTVSKSNKIQNNKDKDKIDRCGI